jgi:hypothetical protein
VGISQYAYFSKYTLPHEYTKYELRITNLEPLQPINFKKEIHNFFEVVNSIGAAAW